MRISSAARFEQLKFAPKPPWATGKWIECETCKRPFYVCPSRLRQVKKKGFVIRYCSRKCRPYHKEFNPFWRKHHSEETIAKMMQHPNHPKFVSGLVDLNAQPRGVSNPNLTRYGSGFRGATVEWWRDYLMETIGYCEECGYDTFPNILILHHIDRNRRHNFRDNLLLLCPNCHATDHWQAKDGIFNGLRASAIDNE